MSWYVSQLLKTKNNVYDSIVTVNRRNESYTMDFDDDVYNDLLSVLRKLKELYESGIISDKDMQLTELVTEGYTVTDAGKMVLVSKPTARVMFKSVSNKIGYVLGGKFTDDGFIAYMIDKYNLSNIQIRKLKKEMNREDL